MCKENFNGVQGLKWVQRAGAELLSGCGVPKTEDPRTRPGVDSGEGTSYYDDSAKS